MKNSYSPRDTLYTVTMTPQWPPRPVYGIRGRNTKIIIKNLSSCRKKKKNDLMYFINEKNCIIIPK